MRAKPDMKPWVHADKNELSSFRSGTFGASICLTSWKCRPLKGLKGCRKRLTQGLRPGLYRSIALTGLLYVFFTNQLRCCFDALALTSKVQCIHRNKYDVLTNVSTRTYTREYTHLLSRVHRTYN